MATLQTTKSRYICVQPCLPAITYTGVRVFGGEMKMQGALAFNTDCNGCKVATSFLTQIQPMLGALGLPLDLLGCLAAVIKTIQALPKALTPPDPTELIDRVTEVLGKCKKVLGITGMIPGGIICEFVFTVNDILQMSKAVLSCFKTLLQHGLVLNIQAQLLLGDVDPQLRRDGECLASRVQRNLAIVNTRASVLSDVLTILKPLLDLLSVTGINFSGLTTGAAAFSAALSVNPLDYAPSEITALISALVAAANALEGDIDLVLTYLGPVVTACDIAG